MAKTTAKHATKKRELIEIAEKLFLEHGYAETSVENILEAAGLSKGGFYHYFKSKEEVLSESVNMLVEDSLEQLDAIVDNATLNGLEKLKLFLQAKSAMQKPKVEYARYLGMLMKSDFTLYKYYISLSRQFLSPLARIVEQGACEGVFNVEFPRETADILIRMMVSVPQSELYSEYVQDPSKYRNYSTAVRSAIAKVLGIDSREIGATEPEAVAILMDSI